MTPTVLPMKSQHGTAGQHHASRVGVLSEDVSEALYLSPPRHVAGDLKGQKVCALSLWRQILRI